MPRKRPETVEEAPVRAGKGRHEVQVDRSIARLRAAGLLAGPVGHLVTALRANGRALDDAEASGNAYATRQATRSIIEIHELLGAPADDGDDPMSWIARVPDHVPEDLV